GLLQHPEDRGGPHVIDDEVRPAHAHVRLHTGATLELLGLPFDRGDEAEMVEDAWTQIGRDPPNRVHRAIDTLDDRLHPARQLTPVVDPLLEPGEVEFESCERLTQLVMDLPRDAGALFLPDEQQSGGEGTQLRA